MNSSLRLLVVATAMVAVLALVAGFAAESERTNRGRTGTETTAVRPRVAPGRTIDVKVPSAKPIEARVGDTLKLTVTLAKDDTVTIDAFGFDETFAAGIPSEVFVTPVAPGTYDLKLQNAGGRVGQLVVKPERPASESAPTGREQRLTPSVTDSNAA